MKKNKKVPPYYDRSYVPSFYFEPYFLRGTYIRRSLDGAWEFLDSKAAALRYMGWVPYEHRVSRAIRKKNLLKCQSQILHDLEAVFGFPFQIDFVFRLCFINYNTVREDYDYYVYEEHKAKDADWFLTCLCGLTLLRHFGGRFIEDKKRGLTVELERVPIDVHIEEKVYRSSNALQLDRWFYDLCSRIWQYDFYHKPFRVEELECITVREGLL